MAKERLIDHTAEIAKVEGINITKKDVKFIVETFTEELRKDLVERERVSYPGLGVWKIHQRKARTGRNPRTGEALNIPAKKTVKFKPSTDLLRRLN